MSCGCRCGRSPEWRLLGLIDPAGRQKPAHRFRIIGPKQVRVTRQGLPGLAEGRIGSAAAGFNGGEAVAGIVTDGVMEAVLAGMTAPRGKSKIVCVGGQPGISEILERIGHPGDSGKTPAIGYFPLSRWCPDGFVQHHKAAALGA
ncbi:hypothetical protein [Proteiniclasticum sp. QWL-01]|uniref:hypothetical protein n=1 Tax=Proteiniclasticum sp. QWL-01 TaxID=3036945 RepID=UPI00240EBE1B|nr:hypothetical protein [Proteiniclasticum sp. QWL-01]WFF72899.1 hypothetical protein P6M73_00025 [Proteiniclasticum sp. QWL-01]